MLHRSRFPSDYTDLEGGAHGSSGGSHQEPAHTRGDRNQPLPSKA